MCVQGGAAMFRWFGVGALVACLLHALIQLLLARRGGAASQQHPNTTSLAYR
jgi:hypothetical protein